MNVFSDELRQEINVCKCLCLDHGQRSVFSNNPRYDFEKLSWMNTDNSCLAYRNLRAELAERWDLSTEDFIENDFDNGLDCDYDYLEYY